MEESQTISVEQAASVLGISRGQGYRLAREGVIPALRLGRRVVVPRVALDRFLVSGEVNGSY